MGEKYLCKNNNLEEMKKKGMSDRVKKILASALVAGNLFAFGSPALACQYSSEILQENAKRVEQLTTMHKYKEMVDSEETLKKHLKELEVEKQSYIDILSGLDKNTPTYDFYEKKLKEVELIKTGVNFLSNSRKHLKEDIQKLSNDPYYTLDKKIISMRSLPAIRSDTKPRIELNLNNNVEFTVEQLNELEKKYHIDHININRFYGDSVTGDKETTRNAITYTPEIYKLLQNEIKVQFGDLKNNTKLTDLEKVTIITKRFQDLNYDQDALNNGIIDKNGVGVAQSAKSAILTDKTICAGASDAFCQVCTYLGIESKEVLGVVEPTYSSHAWSQVKIDGKWYNLDHTVMIVDKDFTNYLKSDKDFNLETEKYIPVIGNYESALESYDSVKVEKAIKSAERYEKQHNKKSLWAKTKSRLEKLKAKLSHKDKTLALDSGKNFEQDNACETEKPNNKREQFLADISMNGKYKENIMRNENSSKDSKTQKKQTDKGVDEK